MALICVTQGIVCHEEELGSLVLFYLVPNDKRGHLVDACVEAISTSEGSFYSGNRSFFDAVKDDKFLTISLPAVTVTGSQFRYYKNLLIPGK